MIGARDRSVQRKARYIRRGERIIQPRRNDLGQLVQPERFCEEGIDASLA
jgi:hypothetical protein